MAKKLRMDWFLFAIAATLALFGVVMVSVTPGTRTQANFAADVSMLVDYAYEPARAETVDQVLNARLDALVRRRGGALALIASLKAFPHR